MPRVNNLLPSGKVQDNLVRLTKQTRHDLKDNGITYTKIANLLNISPQAVSQQFQNGNHITLEVWVASQMLMKGEI